jgi:hypothetical protein
MGFGLWKKLKEGSKKAIGGIGKVKDVVDTVLPTLGNMAGGITDLIVGNRPPKPDSGGPSETGDSFTRLMEKRQILPPWTLKR